MGHSLKYLLSIVLFGMLSSCTTRSAPVVPLAVNSAVPITQSANVMNIVINTKHSMTSPNGDQYICKEFTKTGSRLRTVKKCHTQAEWDLISSETKRSIRDMYIKLGSDHG